PACFLLTPPVSGKRKLPKGPGFPVGGHALWQRGFPLAHHGLHVAETARPLRIVHLAPAAARLHMGSDGGGSGTLARLGELVANAPARPPETAAHRHVVARVLLVNRNLHSGGAKGRTIGCKVNVKPAPPCCGARSTR